MALRFVMSGGNFLFSAGPGASGISFSHVGNIVNSAPAGAGDTFAISAGNQAGYTTLNLGGNFQSLSAGFRFNAVALPSGTQVVIQFNDQSANPQCELRINGTGQVYFTRNGTVIGSTSIATLPVAAWAYIEFQAIFSTTGTGTCTARLNGVVINTATNVTNATTTALAAQAVMAAPGTGAGGYAKDFYVVDGGAASAPFTLTSVDNAGNFTGTITGGGSNAYAGFRFTIGGFTNGANNPVGATCTASTATTLSFSLTTVTETHAGTANNYGATGFQGDIKVVELFLNGPGVNSAWAANVGPFVLTSVDNAGNYTGTITGGAANAYLGYDFNITGFVNGANNPTGAKCTGSTATTLSFAAVATITETHAGSAAFENITQIGINQTGTRPNGDVAYLSDLTPGDISDFAHTTLTLTGSVLGVAHLSYMRKDDAGTRQVAQVCLSGGSTEQSPPKSLGNSYQYFEDFVEVDPNTGIQFTAGGLNASTFGVKLVS